MKLHKTWWGEAFFNYLISFIDEGRLKRGRAYRKDHRVLSFNIDQNIVTATIRGNINPYFGVYKEPKYKVKISFLNIPNKDWKAAIKRISDHPGWLSKLMLNEIPSDIDNAFSNKNHKLLPRSFPDIKTSCSCPDYENPCKHIAGVYYRIAELLDSSPMLLFPMHGLSIENLQTELKKSDLGKVFAKQLSSEQDVHLEISKEQYHPIENIYVEKPYDQNKFWNMPNEYDFDKLDYQEPVNASIIKKQGDYPSFWNKQGSFISSMEAIYTCAKIKNKKNLL